jgi:uncharacterized RDD family membrane protein YckC
VTAGPAVGKLIVVDEDLTLGSAQDGDGTLGDPSLSASHALLTRDHMDAWMVRDLGSAAGTYLNGERLTSIEPLHRGDSLRLGDTRLVVIEGAHRPAQARRAAPPSAARSTLSVPAAPAPWFESAAAAPEPPILEPPAPAQPSGYQRPRLEDRIAPFRTRANAAVIDGVIGAAIAGAIIYTLKTTWFSYVLALGVMLSWDFLFESLRGQTIGKRAMKIKVVRRDGSKLRPQHVAARNVLRILDGAPGLALVGILSIVASGASRRQRLGDLAAGTIVVKSEREMSRLPGEMRDRLILAAYPVLWIAPAIALAVLKPESTIQPCRDADLTSFSAPEKTCLTLGPSGEKLRLRFVNAGHTLHWQGYDVSLLATRAHAVRRLHGAVTVVGLKLAVTNTASTASRFDHRSVRVALMLPFGGELRAARDLPLRNHIHAFPAIATSKPIASGATRVGWVRFALPASAVPSLSMTEASISFLPAEPSPGLIDGGDIRLWRAANAQGAAAARVRND